MLPGLGGPMGRHAASRGLWFRPLPWAILAATAVFVVLVVRHTPCLQTSSTNPINTYIRVCYNDIQTLYLAHGFGTGASPIGGDTLSFPPLIAVAIVLTVLATRGLGVSVGPDADLQMQVDASVAFFAVTAVGLFLCLLIAVVALHFLSRAPGRTWEPLLLAASPIVLAAGLVDWTLVPLALTALGLAQFARRNVVSSGITLGLAACAGTMPIVVVLAVVVACGLRGGRAVALRFGVSAVVTFAVVHLPMLINDFDAVYRFYHGEIHKGTSYGSLWYLASQLGMSLRHTGSLTFVVLLLGLAALIAWLYVTRRRPRIGSLVATMVLATTLVAPVFSPQTALWVVFAVLLVRPFRPELIAVNVAGAGYYLAIWGWIGGGLTTGQLGPYGLYWLAILAVAGVQAWMVVESLLDMAWPRRDPLRTPDGDPIGGVLNDAERQVPLAFAS